MIHNIQGRHSNQCHCAMALVVFCLASKPCFKICLEIMIAQNILPESLEVSKWHWLILDPIGAIVYYANQIYVNRGLFETMSVGLLKHAIFTNHSLQKHKILVLCYFRDNSYNCDYIKQGPTVLY